MTYTLTHERGAVVLTVTNRAGISRRICFASEAYALHWFTLINR